MRQIKTYENSIKKRFIQFLCYSHISGIKSDILCLAGPNALEYINFLQKYCASNPKNKIYSYEKEFNIYSEQVSLTFYNKAIKNRVVFRPGDVIQAEPRQIIDLDFCCNLSTAIPIVKKLFKSQKEQFKTETNVFMFSISAIVYKSGYLENILKFLNELLEISIQSWLEIDMEYGKQFVLKYNATTYNVNLYTYTDTSPMYTIQIIY